MKELKYERYPQPGKPAAGRPRQNRPWFWIAVAIALFSYQLHYQWNALSDTGVPADFHATPGANDVVLLSDQTCLWCEHAKALLASANVPYTEYDVDNTAKGREMFHRLHGVGVPILIINKQVIRGYDRRRILAALR